MQQFSPISKFRLSTCHPDLQVLFNEVIKYFNCTILEGYRGREAQEKAFKEGKTQLHFPFSNHNKNPSMAVDAAPWPIPDWKKTEDFIYFGGIVMGIAIILYSKGEMTYKVRYGGDFNENNFVSDQPFLDAVHFELCGEEDAN
jgi:peptidoglycan L-alanyl-D-glutamate endopeptidase CwlK